MSEMRENLMMVECPWRTGEIAVSGGLLARAVPAGFPSPADDYIESRISLDEHLVRHREATFFLRVEGDSMRDLGILDGDLLVVDRALAPVDGCVVIAVIDGEFTVKQFSRRSAPHAAGSGAPAPGWRGAGDTGGGIVLKAANPAYPDIEITSGRELVLWGVVRWAIHRVWPWNDDQSR